MKNREIADMLIMLDNAVHTMKMFKGDLRTEAGQAFLVDCNGSGAVHMGEYALMEIFGATMAATVKGRDSDQYPVEASYTYKGIKFFAIMTRVRAKELFGYDAPPAPVPDPGGVE